MLGVRNNFGRYVFDTSFFKYYGQNVIIKDERQDSVKTFFFINVIWVNLSMLYIKPKWLGEV